MKKHSLLLKELTAIAPRRGKGEQKACEVILKHLELDTIDKLEPKYLVEAKELLLNKLLA